MVPRQRNGPRLSIGLARGWVLLRSSMCASPSGKTGCSIIEQLRVRRCRSILLQFPRLRQGLPNASRPYNPTTHTRRIKQAATDSRRGPRKQKILFHNRHREALSPYLTEKWSARTPSTLPLDNAHAGDSNCHSVTAVTRRDISLRCKIIIFFYFQAAWMA